MDASDPGRQTVRVTIFNQSYAVATSGDPKDTILLAQEIDDLMANIARRGGNLDSTRTAVLACLHLADKLRLAEKQLSLLRDGVSARTRSLTSLLDRFEGLEPELAHEPSPVATTSPTDPALPFPARDR
jgi:cell division protein ZapA